MPDDCPKMAATPSYIMSKEEEKVHLRGMSLEALRDYGQDQMNSGPDSFNMKILRLEFLYRETQAVVDSAKSLRRHTFWIAVSAGLAAVTFSLATIFELFAH